MLLISTEAAIVSAHLTLLHLPPSVVLVLLLALLLLLHPLQHLPLFHAPYICLIIFDALLLPFFELSIFGVFRHLPAHIILFSLGFRDFNCILFGLNCVFLSFRVFHNEVFQALEVFLCLKFNICFYTLQF
jgi:hypothetical protein